VPDGVAAEREEGMEVGMKVGGHGDLPSAGKNPLQGWVDGPFGAWKPVRC
jgi:hypothetical protein